MAEPDGGRAPAAPVPLAGPACYWPPWEEPPSSPSAPAESPPEPFAPLGSCNRDECEDAFSTEEPSFSAILRTMDGLPAAQRIECISRRFLGLTYIDDPLGEGVNDTIDPDPMYRFDGLDCMTLVEEVLALSVSQNFVDFAQILQEIRYLDGVPLYGWRHHFVEAGWIEENTQKGFIEDITAQVSGGLTQTVSALIDRAWWVDQKPIGEGEKIIIKGEFQDAGLLWPEVATMEYIPMSAFFSVGSSGVEPNWELIGRMPEISVLLMIRHEAAAQQIGVIVAHMAFLIVPRMPDGTPLEPIIRHTSAKERIFKDEPLLDYLFSQAPYRAGVTILSIE